MSGWTGGSHQGITDGIAFGSSSYAPLKLLAGRGREVHWLVVVSAVLLLAKYVVLP